MQSSIFPLFGLKLELGLGLRVRIRHRAWVRAILALAAKEHLGLFQNFAPNGKTENNTGLFSLCRGKIATALKIRLLLRYYIRYYKPGSEFTLYSRPSRNKLIFI